MTAPDQLVVWLRETLDTAQQRAEAAAKETASADWEYREDGRIYATSPPGFMVAAVDYLDPAPGRFMAANDPAAVLRRIAADRNLLGHAERILKGDLSEPAEIGLAEDVVERLAEAWGWKEGEPS